MCNLPDDLDIASDPEADRADALLLRIVPEPNAGGLARLLADLPPRRPAAASSPLRPRDFPEPPLVGDGNAATAD
jgi:hypothetical protein